MAELTSMKYRVFSARHPKTGSTILRPVVTDRNSMSMKQLVAYAKTAGFVRGQQKDLEGLLGGFIEAMQDRAKAGYSINVNNWFIVSGQLKGTVGNDRQLTNENDYHVTITASKDLKVSIDNFSWTRVDDTGTIIKLDGISSPNGNKGEIIKTKAIVATGKNLAFNSAWGDKVVVSWTEDAAKESVELTPSEQSETYLRFDWPTDLAEIPAQTELTFAFRLHGAQGAAEQTDVKTVTLIAAT